VKGFGEEAERRMRGESLITGHEIEKKDEKAVRISGKTFEG
jgi:hypothetical protein